MVSENTQAAWATEGVTLAAARGEALDSVTSSLSVLREAVAAARTVTGKLVGRRGRRRRESIAREYDGSIWKRVLDERRWEKVASLHDYVVPQDSRPRLAKIDGRIVRISTSDYYEFRLAKLQELIALRTIDGEGIIELGCGWGHNLFSLALSRRWKSLRGFDISSNGVAATNQAAAHFGITSVHARQLDLTARSDPAFGEMRGTTVFSYLCLEQLKYSTAAIIENLLAANIRRAIHIEPVPEVLRWWRLGDAANKLYIAGHDYQDNLLSTLRSFERSGRLRVLEVSRLSFAPRPVNDPTLICWESA